MKIIKRALLLAFISYTTLEGMEEDPSGKDLNLKDPPSFYSSEQGNNFSSPLKRKREDEGKNALSPTKKVKRDEINNHLSYLPVEEIISPWLSTLKKVRICEKFLKLDKLIYTRTIAEKKNTEGESVSSLINRYSQEISGEPSKFFDLTGLSARARIYLLTQFLNIKLRTLPNGFRDPNQNFNALCQKTDDDLWEGKDGKLIAKTRVSFKIGEFEYEWENIITPAQKGNGRLYGLRLNDKGDPIADKYQQIIEEIESYTHEERLTFRDLLLQQKKDGKPIKINNNSDARFFNGFNLLLDYEVVRRLAIYYEKGDYYANFPILAYIRNIIDALSNPPLLKELLLGKTAGKWKKEILPDWALWSEGADWKEPLKEEDGEARKKTHSLVTGKSRKLIARLLPICQSTCSINPFFSRENLNFIHMDDENSEDEYNLSPSLEKY